MANDKATATTDEAAPLLNFEQIMAAPDMEPIRLPISEWGGAVELRPLTAGESDECVAGANGPDGKINMSIYAPRVLAASFANPVLSDAQAQAIYANKRGSVILKIIQAVNELNLTTKEASAALDAEFRPIE